MQCIDLNVRTRACETVKALECVAHIIPLSGLQARAASGKATGGTSLTCGSSTLTSPSLVCVPVDGVCVRVFERVRRCVLV